MKTCIYCRMKNEDDYNFCIHCGAELNNTYEKDKEQTPANIHKNEQPIKEASAENNNESYYNIQNQNNFQSKTPDLASQKFKMIYLPFGIALMLAIITGVTANVLIVFLCIPFALWGLLGINQSRHTCPKCKTWNSLKQVNKTETGRYNTTITEKRTAKTYKMNQNSTRRTGYPITETDYYVDVPVQVVNYNIDLCCECCGYKTSRKSTEHHRY